MLVNADGLRGWLREGREIVLLDCRPIEEFERERMTAARPFDAYSLLLTETGDEGLRSFQAEMAQRARAAGIGGDETVVLYDDASGMRSARAFWVLQYLGHPRANVLDGGLSAWKRAQGPSENGPAGKCELGKFAPSPQNGCLATADYVEARRKASDALILDVRNATEYLGADRQDCCPRTGRIPGARWFYWENLLTRAGTFRAKSEMAAELKSRGIVPELEVITYCHRGARAANTYLALKLLGYPRVRNYLGSWHDWSRRGELPVETGAPWNRPVSNAEKLDLP